MKVLLTGATGAIGSKIIDALLAKSKVEIIASSLQPQKARNFNWYNRVTYIPYDLHEGKASLANYFHKPDLLIHLAWEGLPNYDSAHHLESLPAHKTFLRTLIREGLTNIVVAGTCFEYGLEEGECYENSECHPSNQYGLAKYYLLKWLQEERKSQKFNLTWLRLFYSIDTERKSSLFGQLQSAIKNNEKAFGMSGGDQVRDYLPIDVMINYIVEISIMRRDSGIVNCCSGTPKRIVDLVKDFLNRQNSSLKINLGTQPYSSFEPASFWGNNEKLRSLMRNAVATQ